MTLDQRAQKAREQLFVRYDQLNALWLKAEDQLTQLHIPRSVECDFATYDFDLDPRMGKVHECLGLQKVRGKWRICYGSYLDSSEPEPKEWIPITEASAQVRTEAAKHLPKLHRAIVASAEDFILKVDDAIQSLKKTLGESSDIDALLAERSKLNGQTQ